MQPQTVKAVVLTVALFCLSACADNRYVDDPLFDVGYSDGCASAQSPSVGGRPQPRSQEPAYRAGWSAGYGTCGGTSSSGRSEDEIDGGRR